jgi:prophage DNA circulation protein
MADVLSQLLSFQWRGIAFPVASFSTQIAQDHVEHKWPDRDGAHIEATGRAPIVIHAKAIFRNNVAAGPKEIFGTLYPTQFRSFLVAVVDRTSGPLQHPELGAINCKVKTADVDWDANKRDGADVSVTWIESFDDSSQFDQVLASPSPVAVLYSSAFDLDSQLTQYNVPIPKLPTISGESFTQLISQITAITDQASLLNRQIGGYVDHALYRLSALSDSVMALKDSQTWPIFNSIERLRASLATYRLQQLQKTLNVSIYIVPKDQNLSSVATTVASSVSDLVKLNPLAASSAVVKSGTVIRYYQAS